MSHVTHMIESCFTHRQRRDSNNEKGEGRSPLARSASKRKLQRLGTAVFDRYLSGSRRKSPISSQKSPISPQKSEQAQTAARTAVFDEYLTGSRRKTPIFQRKSRVSPQKSSVSLQKSPVSLQKSPVFDGHLTGSRRKTSMSLQKSLHISPQSSPCLRNKALYVCKKALFLPRKLQLIDTAVCNQYLACTDRCRSAERAPIAL